MSLRILKRVSDNLCRYRLQSGLTQQQVGAFLDVSYQQIQKYEKGKNKIPIDKLYLLAQIYELSIDDFFK